MLERNTVGCVGSVTLSSKKSQQFLLVQKRLSVEKKAMVKFEVELFGQLGHNDFFFN